MRYEAPTPRAPVSEAVDEVPPFRGGRGPEPDRAVDVQPRRAVLADEVGQRPDRVEGARVDVARLRADERRARVARERLGERVGAHPALVVRGDPLGLAGAEPEEAQRA